jgi:hypothetical protein
VTFWQRRVDSDVLEVVSARLGVEVDPLTELSLGGPRLLSLNDFKGLARAVEGRCDVTLPLFAWDTWQTVGQVQASVRAAVMRKMMGESQPLS